MSKLKCTLKIYQSYNDFELILDLKIINSLRISKLTQCIDLYVLSFVRLLHIITICRIKTVTNNFKNLIQ